MNQEGKLFESWRLESFIEESALRTPSETVSFLIDRLRVFTGTDSFDDDISCVVVDVL
jgi:serine phosphatase RsbU (regulator of sigma subunit)